MSATKPTIILVHGAWHSPEHFRPLEQALNSSQPPSSSGGGSGGDNGYRTISPWLPSMHYARLRLPPPSNIADDIAAIRQAIVSELTSHPTTNVVVLSHSYGTVPATAALEGLDMATRARAGHDNGVTAHLIISGLLAPVGTSLLDWGGGQVPPTMVLSTVPVPLSSSGGDKTGGVEKGIGKVKVCTPVKDPGPVALFYHDLAERDAPAAEHYASLCVPQVWAVQETVVPFAPWSPPGAETKWKPESSSETPSKIDSQTQSRSGLISNPDSDPNTETGTGTGTGIGLDIHYLVCEDDRALPAAIQRVMIDGADKGITAHYHHPHPSTTAQGSKIHVTAINSGHCPFLSRVDETVRWVRRCCGEGEV
ncbi:hypothetical protein Z517_06513 [Fonsecaea pedrosoi CBS 271.37]|uniref:AB hydrolase-1 domain-containing protein n=1 Tax=Fonsecaea pedrosoi CBS 271.37 TaxID=1442368 RepID=A0A0D2GGI5_9EURO|nr:uncharacterized protein Z517_06513 [Fonsecaea pedrosoi CBS 271.37]KIW79898.1 hypothetical protein Z517_06513 [Fonsecaea pedrosoi CBS 271.37]